MVRWKRDNAAGECGRRCDDHSRGAIADVRAVRHRDRGAGRDHPYAQGADGHDPLHEQGVHTACVTCPHRQVVRR